MFLMFVCFTEDKDDRYHLFSFGSHFPLEPLLFQCLIYPYTATSVVKFSHVKYAVCIQAAQILQLFVDFSFLTAFNMNFHSLPPGQSVVFSSLYSIFHSGCLTASCRP